MLCLEPRGAAARWRQFIMIEGALVTNSIAAREAGPQSAPLSRRNLLACGVAALLLYSQQSTSAESDKIPLLGWLSSAPGSDPLLDAFRTGLRGLDYVEGRSINIKPRSAQSNADLRALARDLVRQKVDVLVANGRAATRAAQEATEVIPIVMAPVDDPYEFVASLSRPSGNITGLALQQTEIDSKQIEILKEVVPSLSRLVIFYYYGETYYALESVARALGIEVLWIETGIANVESSFAEAVAKKANGILIVNTSALGSACDMIAEMALAHRIPAAGSWRRVDQNELLLTYVADDAHLQRRAAAYVDRLLKGAKPNDLPVEQASQFNLIVNLSVAKKLGVTIPLSVLLRANQVID
jgi:putative ABC transport system substrate-binding protein